MSNTCVIYNQCTGNKVFNQITNQCECPLTAKHWNGSSCVACGLGMIWNSLTLTCVCPPGSGWNGQLCLICSGGKIFNPNTNDCQCPQNYIWNSNTNICILINTCTGGRIFNQLNGQC